MKKHRGRHLLSLLASAALLASLLPAAFAAEAEGEKHITILGTSDMHGNIWGYSYEDNAETDNNGMARLYTYIQQVRAENPNTFLVDAGDDIQGTIMTDDLYNNSGTGQLPGSGRQRHRRPGRAGHRRGLDDCGAGRREAGRHRRGHPGCPHLGQRQGRH